MALKIYKLTVGNRQYEYWYERSHRCWYAAEVDQMGNLGESIQEYRKDQIVRSIQCDFVPRVKLYREDNKE
jgi:hypothetical protein